MKEEKKVYKLNLIILLLIVVIIALVGIIFIKKYAEINSVTKNGKIDTSNEKVLIEFANENYAWGFFYSGKIITTSGNIYEFEYDKNEAMASQIKDLNEKSENILQHKKNKKSTISQKDLEKINQFSEQIEEDYKEEFKAYDSGQKYIKLYKYNENKQVTIISNGDYNITTNR